MDPRRLLAASLVVALLLAASCRPPDVHVDRDVSAVEAMLRAGQYAAAEDLARRLFDATRNRSSAERAPARIGVVLVGALVLNGKGAIPATRQLAEQVAFPGPRGAGDAADADALVALGRVLTAAGDHDAAVHQLQRAVSTLERSGEAPVVVADALDHLGRALTAGRRYDEALEVLERSLRVKEQALHPNDEKLARTLEAIGWARQLKGDYPAARRAVDRAVAIQEAANPEHPALVEGLDLLHQQLWFEGRIVESRDAARRAVALAERTLRSDHPMLARSLRYLAMAEWTLGDLPQGHALWQRAFEIAVANFGEEHHETAMYLHDLALADSGLGDYPIARVRFEKAARLFESRYGEWHDFVATALHNLAVVDASLGDIEAARRRQARATAIWERTLGEGHPFVAFGLTELAAVLRTQGQLDEAQALSQRALAIREKTLGPDHPDVARTLEDLASTVMLSGRLDAAQALARRALDIWERQKVADAPELAAALTLYAEVQTRRGMVNEGRRAFERAMSIRLRTLGPHHPAVAETQAGLAVAEARSGRAGDALADAVAAETTAREHLRLVLRNLSERQSLSYAASRPTGVPLMLSLAGRVVEARTDGLDAIVRGRALVLDEMAARRRADAAGGDGTVGDQPLKQAQQRLANLLVRGPGELSPQMYGQLVDDARQASEREEQRLAARNPAFRSGRDDAQVGWRAVQAALSAGDALVSYVKHDGLSLARAGSSPGAGPGAPAPGYVAFVLRSQGPPSFVSLGAADVVDGLVSRWRGDVATATDSARRSGERLRARIWDPVARHLQGVSRVFVVPDGAVALIPFDGLAVGPSSYLIETGPVIHYLSAERDLVTIRRREASKSAGILAFGGPAFDDRPDSGPDSTPAARGPETDSPSRRAGNCDDLSTIHFAGLAGTALEVQELQAVWQRAGIPSESVLARLGARASEAAIKAEAARYRVLHIATHGFFLGAGCGGSTGSARRGVGGVVGGASAATSPLRLSGLALAGANRRARAKPDEDDGILTAEEVAMLDLQGVEWAVLSACDTGIGEVRAGEGVFGLRRAFQVAGARTVIMSLWSVDDQATRAWMRALYEGRFERRMVTADAVHQASLTVLRERRAQGLSTHPFYWAAFVAAGDWR